MCSQENVSSNHNLPLILVSASDVDNARVLIKEIINSDKVNSNEQTSSKIVWQIANKYYQVEVEMYPLADDAKLPEMLGDRMEAHIIYITEEEDNSAATERAEARWSAAGGERASVRLLLLAARAASPALQAWSRRRRYEPVPLREAPCGDDDDDDAPFPETYAAERARAALHAHAWRGLRRVDGGEARRELVADDYNDDDDDDEAAVERAEAFVEALGALGEEGAGAAGESREERLARAERLVAAFCRALGSDLPAL